MDVSIGCLRCWYSMLTAGQVPVLSFEPLCSTLCDARHTIVKANAFAAAELFMPSFWSPLCSVFPCRDLQYLLVLPRHGAHARGFAADSW